MARNIVLALSTIFKVRGGIPRFNQMFCLAVDQLADELDFECTVFSIDDSLEDYEDAGAPWTRLKLVPCGSQFGLMRKTWLHCARTRPDILIAGILGMSPVGLFASPFLKSGYGYFAHGGEVWEKPKWSRNFSASRASRAFPVSRDTGKELNRTTGFPLENMRVLNNTLEPSFECEAHQPETRSVEDGFDILSVARLWQSERKKGIDTTIEAFSGVAGKYPGVKYRIIGKGDDKPRLIELAASLGIADKVVFEEDLTDDDLVRRYKDCGIFALPSGQEGFGIVFLEAMRFSKPCIGGNIGGTPEVIEDGETGLLVPFGDVEAAADALNRLIPDKNLRQRMGHAGLQRLENKFLFRHYKERVREYLEEWLRERS